MHKVLCQPSIYWYKLLKCFCVLLFIFTPSSLFVSFLSQSPLTLRSWRCERWKIGAWIFAGRRDSMETAPSPPTTLSIRTRQVTWFKLFNFFLFRSWQNLNESVLSSDTWELKHATRNISPTNNQANIVDLHPASVYSIRMFSYNSIGKSEASKELTISTEEART